MWPPIFTDIITEIPKKIGACACSEYQVFLLLPLRRSGEEANHYGTNDQYHVSAMR